MKTLITSFLAMSFLSYAQPMVGGYQSVSPKGKEVVEAATFAVQAEQAAMKKGDAAPKLELVEVVSVEQQIVAGMNYRMALKVKVDGKEKNAATTVWWQPWRKPDPYLLRAWQWK